MHSYEKKWSKEDLNPTCSTTSDDMQDSSVLFMLEICTKSVTKNIQYMIREGAQSGSE